MTTVFNIVGLVFLVLAFAVFVLLMTAAVHFYLWFHCRSCKYCHHTLEHKGLRDDDKGGHYLFHCPHCGAWEEVPRDEFFSGLERGINQHDFPV